MVSAPPTDGGEMWDAIPGALLPNCDGNQVEKAVRVTLLQPGETTVRHKTCGLPSLGDTGACVEATGMSSHFNPSFSKSPSGLGHIKYISPPGDRNTFAELN